MTRSVLAIFSLVLTTALFSWPASAASQEENDPQQALVDVLRELKGEVKALRSEVGQLRQAVSDLRRATVSSARAAKPAPKLVDIALGNGPMLGDPGAKVGIVEFTDFQCPFCKRFHQETFAKLKEAYIDTGKIRYAVRDFPLGFHRQAKAAAVAAHCAGEQDAYWAMSHDLFVHQRRLGTELYQELAGRHGFDLDAFRACLESPEKAKVVEANFEYGQSVGVRGTPNFFIGRIQDGKLVKARRISGAQSVSAFSRTLDALLR